MITYPDRGNPGLRRTDNAAGRPGGIEDYVTLEASAASGVVEDCAAMHFASTEYGKHFPRRENLAAADGQAETR